LAEDIWRIYCQKQFLKSSLKGNFQENAKNVIPSNSGGCEGL